MLKSPQIRYSTQTLREKRSYGFSFVDQKVTSVSSTLTDPTGTANIPPGVIENLPSNNITMNLGPLSITGKWVLTMDCTLEDGQIQELIFNIEVTT